MITHDHTLPLDHSRSHSPARPPRRREPKDVGEGEGAEGGAAAAGGRDVFNEKPSLEDMIAAEGQAA